MASSPGRINESPPVMPSDGDRNADRGGLVEDLGRGLAVDGEHVAALVLAEEEGVQGRATGHAGRTAADARPPSPSRRARRRGRRPSSRAPCRPPRADQVAHEIAVALLGLEIDGRRRALFAAADVAQIDRLAEPALASRRRAGSASPSRLKASVA